MILKNFSLSLLLILATSFLDGAKSQNLTAIDSLKHLLEHNPSDSARVIVYSQLAREHFYVDINKAFDWASQSVRLADSADLDHEKAYGLRILGTILSEQGDYVRGSQYILDALEVFKKYSDQLGEGNCFISLSLAYFEKGDHEKSIRYIRQALEIFKELENDERIAICYSDLGRTLEEQDELDSAEFYIAKAIQLNNRMSNHTVLQHNYRSLGKVYYKRGKLREAEEYFNKVVTIHSTTNEKSNTQSTSEAYIWLAKIKIGQNHMDKATYNIDRAIELSSRYGYLDLLRHAYLTKIELQQSGDNLKVIEEALSSYSALMDSILKREKNNRIEMVNWYNERLDQQSRMSVIENEKAASEQTIFRQKNQLIALVIIIFLIAVVGIILLNNYREQKKFSRELNAKNEQISKQKETLEKLNTTKNKLFSIIAHDFRSPFNSILGISNLLMKHVESFDKKEVEKVAKEINQSVTNTLKLADNLLTWARTQMEGIEANPEHFNVRKLLETVCEMTTAEAKVKHLKVYNKIEEELTAFADKNQMETVFRNILSNAIKFSPDNDTVTISAKEENGDVTVFIRDNGIGMSETVKNNLFDLHKKTTMKGTRGEIGTGLGLLVSKEFIDENKGSIRVASEENVGTTFFITLPKN